jgi:hypothetical protein
VVVASKSLLSMLHQHFHIIYEFTNLVDFFSLGLLPIIQQIKCSGRVVESFETIETLKDHLGKVLLEAFIDGMHYTCSITFLDVAILSLLLFIVIMLDDLDILSLVKNKCV